MEAIHLSTVQQAAVEHIGSPVLVTAGAGSGKTRVLTAKIAHLVLNLGYDPARILGITFTNKAAREMTHRLEQISGYPRTEFPWVRTFHSACLRILKAHCELMGYKDPINVCSEYHQEKHLKAILLAANLDPQKYLKALDSAISMAKNSGLPEVYLKTVDIRGLHISVIEALYKEYQKRLKTSNSVDFDDILLVTRDLLRKEMAIRRQYADYFQMVLVDEYQDTNDLQEEITSLLVRNGNLFVVGDDYQSIYKFRGANIHNFMDFVRRHKGAKIFKLEQNHRSASEIVEVANELIAHNKQMEKRCFSEKRGGRIQVRELANEYDEAKWTVGQLRGLRRMGIPWEKMAILYRSNALSLPFEQELKLNGVPYKLKGDKGFMERREILDLNCYILSAVHPLDDVSFERIINVPKRGIGKGAMGKIMVLKQAGMGLQDACREAVLRKAVSAKITAELEKLLWFLASIRTAPPEMALRKVLIDAGYANFMEDYCGGAKTREFISRMENVEALLYVASQKADMTQYLEEVTLDPADEREDANKEENKAGVTLSTIHGSKGLEWEVVHVVGMEEGLFPHWRSIEEGAEGIQEERRLAYVAFTRAIRFLNISHVQRRKNEYPAPSLFLREAGIA